MTPAVDYDEVAPSYDRRYVAREYSGIASILHKFAVGSEHALEVGCGTGYWLRTLVQQHRAIGLDPSRQMLGEARSQGSVALVRACAESLPFASNSFDFVVAVNALHHFTGLVSFAEEAMRVLRPGGRVATIGLDPSKGRDSWFIYDYFERAHDLDQERYPSSAVISQSFAAAGFEALETVVADRIVESRSAAEYLKSGEFGRHSTSQLSLLSDEEFEAGVALLEQEVAHEVRSGNALQVGCDLSIYATSGRNPA